MKYPAQNQIVETHAAAASDQQTLEVAADTAHLEEIIRFTEQALDKYGIEGETRGQICVAIDEIVTNIIMYAYPQANGTVRVTIERRDNRMMIEIIDTGLPFNPLQHPVPDTNASIETRLIGGLGIHLTRHMMDELNYRHVDNKNCLVMLKHLGKSK